MPGTTRTPASDRAVQWDSSRTVARGVSTTVEQRRARALGQDKDKKRGGGGNHPKSDGPSSETVSNIFGLLWIAFGAVVIILCAIFVVGSVIMFGVLHEISDARNFDAAASQTSAHEDFFAQVAAAGFKVANDKPNIKEGVTQYLWTVSPPNEGPMRVFSWQHDLENNEMRPTSNAAALLDIDLGLLDKDKAEEYSQYEGRRVFDFDPQDAVTSAIIDRNVAAFARNNDQGWGQPDVIANAPPLPEPLISPKARTRKGVGAGAASAEDEEATTEENPTEGEEGEPTEDPTAPPAAEPEPEPEPEAPEPPTEVIPAPPADDAGDGNADDGGERFPPPPGDDEGDGDGGEATPVG